MAAGNGNGVWVRYVIGGACAAGLLLMNTHSHHDLLDKELFDAQIKPLTKQVSAIDKKVDQIITKQNQDRGLAMQEGSSGAPYQEE